MLDMCDIYLYHLQVGGEQPIKFQVPRTDPKLFTQCMYHFQSCSYSQAQFQSTHLISAFLFNWIQGFAQTCYNGLHLWVFLSANTTPMEHLHGCFAAVLADQGLAPQMGKSYLSAVHSMQILLALPDPREHFFLPIFWRVVSAMQDYWVGHQLHHPELDSLSWLLCSLR